MAGGCHKVKCANEKKREKKEESEIILRTMPFSFSFFSLFLIILIKNSRFLINKIAGRLEPRRPPMKDEGTETAFRLDQCKHFRKVNIS